MRAVVRNDIPTARNRTDTPTVRTQVGAILTPGTDTVVQAGTPIGLLLVLTYANNITISTLPTFKGFVPTAKIRNNG